MVAAVGNYHTAFQNQVKLTNEQQADGDGTRRLESPVLTGVSLGVSPSRWTWKQGPLVYQPQHQRCCAG